MNDSSQLATKRLQAAGRSKDYAKRLAWGLLIASITLFSLLALALADYWLVLAAALRIAGVIVLTLMLVAGFTGWLNLRRRPTSLKEAALDTEARRPDLGCVVSTAAEYISGDRTITQEYEPELVAALEDQAAQDLEKVNPSYTNRLSRPAICLVLALLTLLVFAAFVPVSFTALKRTVVPWSKETYTKVEVHPGSADLPVGSDLDITNLFSGRVPKDPALHWQETAKPAGWQTVALKRSEDGYYIHPFKSLQADMRYKVTGNDAESEIYGITTYVPPEVRVLRVDVAYPAYTRVKPFYQQSPDLTVLRATELSFRITPSTTLSKARLRFASLPGLDLAPGPDGQWTASFKTATNTDYWIELADAKGHQGSNDKPYHIKVLPDNPPKITIIEPGKDIRADATNQVPLKIAASDDFGVGEIKVIYHKLGSPDKVLPCAFTNTVSGEVMGGVSIPLADLALKEYEVVAYHAEARDNNSLDGPGVGKSPVYFIEVHSDADDPNKPKQPKPEKADRLNLLAVQKQIVADTTALRQEDPAAKFDELSTRQKEAADYAEIYRQALKSLETPPEAVQLMDDALREMKSASSSLTDKKRDPALPSEEKALADLYQVLKAMPQLKNLPTQPPQPQEEQLTQDPALNVVLDAIKKQKKDPPTAEELAKALEQAKELSRSQADVLQDVQHPGQRDENGEQAQAQAPDENGKPDSQQQSQQGKPGKGQKGKGKAQQAKAGQKQGGQAQGQPAPADQQDQDQQDQPGQQDQNEQNKTGEQNQAQTKEGQPGPKPGQPNKDQQAKAGAKQGNGKQDQQAKTEPKPGDSKDDPQAKDDSNADDSKDQQQANAGAKAGGGKQGQHPKTAASPVQPKDNPPQNAQAKAGSGQQGQQPDPNAEPADPKENQELERLAELEEQLSKEVEALAEQLKKLAVKDNRLPHKAAEKATEAAGQMGAAAQSLRKGNRGAAGTEGGQGLLNLDKVIASLERLSKDQPNRTDVASEDSPKEYESLISEYLRKLSHEQ